MYLKFATAKRPSRNQCNILGAKEDEEEELLFEGAVEPSRRVAEVLLLARGHTILIVDWSENAGISDHQWEVLLCPERVHHE